MNIKTQSLMYHYPKERIKDSFDIGDFPQIKLGILEGFIKIEKEMNQLIYSYFLPEKNHNIFKEVLLNSSILTIGAKCKVLNNMKGFDKKITGKINELASLRNGIAHVLVIVETKSKETIHFADVTNGSIVKIHGENRNTIETMNSSGQLKEKRLETEYDKYVINYNQVLEYFKKYSEEHFKQQSSN